VIHLDMTPDEGWPMRLWSQNTSLMRFELDGVRMSSCGFKAMMVISLSL
jgi:hypothetical protein